MSDNPFISDTFINVWTRHFNNGNAPLSFDGLKGVKLVKNVGKPIMINTGKNLTKGLGYTVDTKKLAALGSGVILIQDVMSNSGVYKTGNTSKIGLKKIPQYPGFLINMDNVESLDSFMKSKFKKSSRYKFKKYRKRLESSFNISYEILKGSISKEYHDLVFDDFKTLLERRFHQKKEYNNNLDPEEWRFYKEVAYPMIQEEKAALFIIRNDNELVAANLLFLDNQRIIDAIRVFDIDFAKFRLGTVSIMALIEWALENGYTSIDFSKGHYDYKERWSTQTYTFEYHVLYNPKSMVSRAIASYISSKLHLKTFLRKKGLNVLFHKIRYRIKERNSGTIKDKGSYQLVDELVNHPESEWQEVALNNLKPKVKSLVFDFLYLTMEKSSLTKLYQALGPMPVFKINGEKHVKYIVVSNENLN
ncbi:GNAT family N-acetyltransferase [Muricauda sp. 2012CJ35-5]|uniref:GNAT family N-acetyltransferase n=1 Tax=Flagellimonas spongiicola TaxID=2942208 RepID=A0ABT0PVY3_9FLAO|nr:GNAT family N-acetyltransferase [Allomuricauda spongiicola]MCL6275529.1 GNAT family N-acetyltransferase [Allomuricauda spongiicola]